MAGAAVGVGAVQGEGDPLDVAVVVKRGGQVVDQLRAVGAMEAVDVEGDDAGAGDGLVP